MDDYPIDDRIQGLKTVLVEVDKERSAELKKLNFISFDENEETNYKPNAKLTEIGAAWSWKLFGPEAEQKKQEALKQLEALSQELELEHEHEHENEKPKPVTRVIVPKVKEYVVPDVYMLIIFLSMLLYVVYVLIGLGKAHIKLFEQE
jgi:hypothetical protein